MVGISMEHRASGDFLMIKLDDGEDVHSSLRSICEEHGFRMGWVHSGIGILRDFVLGYFTGKEYLKKRFEESHELLSMTGTVTLDADAPIHLHCSVASREYQVIGGHLFEGTVTNLNEIMIQRAPPDISLGRVYNPKTNNYELRVE